MQSGAGRIGVDGLSTQRPWAKIIEENQFARQTLLLVLMTDAWKIREQAKAESAIKRPEKIILMAR
jgi:hypothetical protein